MKFVTPADLKLFRERHAHDPDAALQYALNCADDYAEQHAANALPSIKNAIAQLVFRYTVQSDPGEKQLIQVAIDSLIELGRAINDCAQS